jgi:hypothetical protein
MILTVLQIVRIECERNRVEVQTDLADELPDVLGDSVQLQQVVLNLVMNAIEAMHSAQSRILRIETRQSGHGMVRVSSETPGQALIHPTSAASSSACSRPNRRAWGWVSPSASRSSRATTGEFGRIRARNGSVFHFELPAACGAAVA